MLFRFTTVCMPNLILFISWFMLCINLFLERIDNVCLRKRLAKPVLRLHTCSRWVRTRHWPKHVNHTSKKRSPTSLASGVGAEAAKAERETSVEGEQPGSGEKISLSLSAMRGASPLPPSCFPGEKGSLMPFACERQEGWKSLLLASKNRPDDIKVVPRLELGRCIPSSPVVQFL